MPARKSENVIGYAEIARKMGVKVQSVYSVRARDADFPAPVTPDWVRTPGFSEAEIDRYIALREVRNAGKSGRPPQSADRVEVAPEANERVRELIQQHTTFAAIADLVGVTPTAIWLRLRGRARWKRSELEVLAEKFGTTVEDLVSVSARKPRRSTSAAKK